MKNDTRLYKTTFHLKSCFYYLSDFYLTRLESYGSLYLNNKERDRKMVVDKKGNLFEDRRKAKEDRRKNTLDIAGGRRKKDRRKTTTSQILDETKKEK